MARGWGATSASRRWPPSLASLWNEHVLEKPTARCRIPTTPSLRTCKGRHLFGGAAHPGGITPEGLITIGEVARKYGLYTKITGGQRISLFGAGSTSCPPSGGELVAAGFETGQAYGKSVRTVKSCVGSTWCRYRCRTP